MISNFRIISTVDPVDATITRKVAVDGSGRQLGEAIVQQVAETGKAIYGTKNFLRSYATEESSAIFGLCAKPHMHLEKLEVGETFRRQGVGRRLVQSVVQDSFEKGLDGRVVVMAQNNRVSPLPFYRKLGFSSGNGALDRRIDKFLEFPLGIFRECTAVMMIPKKIAKTFVKSL